MPNVETDAPTVAAPVLLELLELLVEVPEGLLEPEAEPVDEALLAPVELAPAEAEPLSWTAVFTQLDGSSQPLCQPLYAVSSLPGIRASNDAGLGSESLGTTAVLERGNNVGVNGQINNPSEGCAALLGELLDRSLASTCSHKIRMMRS